MTEQANPVGRPTDYRDEFAEQARKLCLLGATDMELADFFDVHVATIYRWRNAIPEFCEAVTCGKDANDNRVERSMYNRAVGYNYPAVKIFMPSGAGEPIYAPYTEHVPPDPGAAMNWLKNRRREDWQDSKKLDVDATGELAAAIAERRARLNADNG